MAPKLHNSISTLSTERFGNVHTQPSLLPIGKVKNSFLTILIYLFLILILLLTSASIILHTILQSIRPASSQTYHDPTLARMQPLSTSATTETLESLTPDIQALVVEANIKNNHAGPIATAWEAALLKAIRLPPNDSDTPPPLEKDGVEKNGKQSPPERPSSTTPYRTKNFWEKEVVEEVTVVPVTVSEPPPLMEKH